MSCVLSDVRQRETETERQRDYELLTVSRRLQQAGRPGSAGPGPHWPASSLPSSACQLSHKGHDPGWRWQSLSVPLCGPPDPLTGAWQLELSFLNSCILLNPFSLMNTRGHLLLTGWLNGGGVLGLDPQPEAESLGRVSEMNPITAGAGALGAGTHFQDGDAGGEFKGDHMHALEGGT